MMHVGLVQILLWLLCFSHTRGSAPGDEHDYCVNTFNVENPPSAREDGRNILLDTYNYAALLTGVIDFTNPVISTYSPVFQSFDVDGSSPSLGWNQFRPVGNCRLRIADCKFEGVTNPPLQDNWLVTQFIRLDSSHKEMRVFVRHSITLCTEGTVCRNSYSAYVFPANEGTNITLATVTNPTVNRLDPPFAEADSDVHSRYVSFSHMADMYNGFYIALRSEDTCVQVHRLQVFYWTCPGGLQGLAEVDGTAEPLESRTFRCIGNSTQRAAGDRLICIVDSRGEEEYSEWRLSGSGTAVSISKVCQCNPGFQLLIGGCSECPEGMFKEGYSNDVCTLCPEYSFTNVTGSASCQCVNGRYRGTMGSASLPCALPPSAPNNLTLMGFSSRTVSLSWEPPLFNGSRSTFFYIIWYRRVGDTEWTEGDTVMDNGNDPVVNYTQSGLIPYSKHIVRVTADNMATDTVPEELTYLRSLNITVMTLSDVPGIGSTPILTSPRFADFITITLVPPVFPNGVILQYNIRWYREEQENGAQVVNVPGTQQSYALSGLSSGTYFVQVQAVSAQGVGNYSDPVAFTVESFPEGYIGAIVTVISLVIIGVIVIALVCLTWRCYTNRRSRGKAQLPLNSSTGIYEEVDNVAMHSNPSYSAILTSVRDHGNSVSGTSVDDEQLDHHTGTVSADSQVEDPEEGSYNYI